MTIKSINTDRAPAAIGPYSQAAIAGGMLYVSGQIPLDPETGETVGQDAAAQARRVLENLKAVIQAADSTLADVVKVTIYLTDMKQFSVVNEVYATYFSEPYPARACVQVSELPKGVDVEMDAIVQLS